MTMDRFMGTRLGKGDTATVDAKDLKRYISGFSACEAKLKAAEISIARLLKQVNKYRADNQALIQRINDLPETDEVSA